MPKVKEITLREYDCETEFTNTAIYKEIYAKYLSVILVNGISTGNGKDYLAVLEFVEKRLGLLED